ncbi:MAG: hypothetical protein CMH83_19295 [Nocardioides sp.]|nr:hypothetical protein [Nocardioides sp.]
MPARSASHSVRRLALLAALPVLLSLLVAPRADAAAPPAPTDLAPSGSSVSGSPTLSWSPVREATKYEVQVATDAEFTNRVWNQTTTNVASTPTGQLPLGTLRWRVRAVAVSDPGPWATAEFTRTAVSPPVQTSPEHLSSLSQPYEALEFAWEPVAGATAYELQIGSDPQFVDPALISTYTTPTTTYTLSQLAEVGTSQWRVRAKLDTGLFSEWSSVRSYTVTGLASMPQVISATGIPVSPAEGELVTDDLELDWPSVPGAATYEVQVSDDRNFLTVTHAKAGILGTTYSPPTTLRSNQYFWRVRGVDVSGHAPAWGDQAFGFDLKWLEQPHAVYPDGETVGDPLFYQWTPLARASTYTLLVSQDSTFPENNRTQSCTTIHTTYVPGGCRPTSAGTWFWRVLANDAPSGQGTVLLSADVNTFVYDPEQVTPISPADGELTDVPTMHWSSVPGFETYRVTLTDTVTGDVASEDTHTTSLTWPTLLDPEAVYRWQVQTVAEGGELGPAQPVADQRTFSVEPPEAEGTYPDVITPTGGLFRDFPTLRWTPVAGADHYRVHLVDEHGDETELAADFAYPAAEYAGAALGDGTWQWFVAAFDGDRALGTSTGTGSFSIETDAVADATYGVALAGASTLGVGGAARDVCDAELPQNCQNLRQSPVLSWEPARGATSYRLYLARDAEMTNPVPGYAFPTPVSNTMWQSTKAFDDAQAQSAYFWEVVPCSNSVCQPPDFPTHQFNKETVGPDLVGPVSDGEDLTVVADDVRLEWSPWLDSQVTHPVTDTTLKYSHAEVSAKTYTVQTSIDEDFATRLETIDVDQTWLTSYATTYPEGPIYWRVRANDQNGKASNWSETGTFQKRSPTPVLRDPAPGAPLPGDGPFTWDPLDFAAKYRVQVFTAGTVAVGQPVRNEVVLQPSWAPRTALPVNDIGYEWRVARIDAKGRQGDWSPVRAFTVRGEAPDLLLPGDGVAVAPRETTFTWDLLERARQYRWELRRLGGGNLTTVTTVATAWAHNSPIPTGDWEWRVTALDPGGASLGTSDWRPFTTSSGPAVVRQVAVSGTGEIGSTLSLEPPIWAPAVPADQITYQWYRKTGRSTPGTPIDGATGTVYQLVPDDYGHEIRVVATGWLQGYDDATSTSEPFGPGLGQAVAPLTPPRIIGRAAIGNTVTGNPGTWPDGTRLSYQWYRGNEPINRADDATYTVRGEDAGLPLHFAVTGRSTGRVDAFVVATTRVAKAGTTTTLTVEPTTFRQRQRARATITVTSLGPEPSGTISVLDGRKKLKTLRLRQETTTLRLPRLKKGKHLLKAVYSGNSRLSGSRGVARIKVRR